jgi:hypothetical protein
MVAEREATFAGRFYPEDRDHCERMLEHLLRDVGGPAAEGAIVPHAGWIYSGSTAGLGISAIARKRPATVVIFGAVHVATRHAASLFPAGIWHTPLGSTQIDEELAERMARCPDVMVDAAVHRNEHSIEVQLPLLQRLLPDAQIVPIMVRPGPWAEEVGRCCAREARGLGRVIAFLGSTDLTHYGPSFGFEPHGHGADGIRWAKEINDRRFISLIKDLNAAGVVPEAAVSHNACGAGAVGAAIGAALELGTKRYEELQHATSADYEYAQGLRPVNSVGYHAGAFVAM